jgi:hypothetical protein
MVVLQQRPALAGTAMLIEKAGQMRRAPASPKTAHSSKKDLNQPQKEMLMNSNRSAKSLVVAVAFVSIFATPALARAQGAPTSSMHSPSAAAHSIQPKRDSLPQDDFAGLTYTDEQKAEIDKIHREMQSNMAAVVADEKLNADQKNAMLQGYARIEGGRRFQVLSPEQQRQVRQRIAARHAAEQAANKQPPPRK